MEAFSMSSPLIHLPKMGISANHNPILSCRCRRKHQTGHVTPTKISAIDGVADLAPVEITWQIAFGAFAGITPFIVAGFEFSKRIVAQRKCEVCGGSGLVLRDETYTRCPGCGGFLPWQSWKRFFTG